MKDSYPLSTSFVRGYLSLWKVRLCTISHLLHVDFMQMPRPEGLPECPICSLQPTQNYSMPFMADERQLRSFFHEIITVLLLIHYFQWYYTRTMLAMLKAEYLAYDADLDPQLVEGLGTSRLYAYLVAENVFPRPESPITSIKIEELALAEQAVPTAQTPMGPTRYCGACGLNVLTHPSTTQVLEPSGFACAISRTLQRPICDIALWTMLRPVREHIRQVNLAPGAITTQGVRAPIRGASYLVECASPQMVIAFHALTRSWGLKAFEYSSKRRNPAALADRSRALGSRFPLDALGVDASHVDRTLAPHALLVLVAKVFIRRLIAEVLRARDEMLGELTHAPGPSVLTSTHISRALMDGRNSEGWLPLMTVARPGFVRTGSTQG